MERIRKFQLLKDILDYHAGYIMVVEDDMGYLGFDREWKIPLFIIESNPEWFFEIKLGIDKLSKV